MYITGTRDQILPYGPFSPLSPQRNRKSTKARPMYLAEGFGHCEVDVYGLGDLTREPEAVRKAHEFEVEVVKEWLRHGWEWNGDDEGHAD
jgi:hypothetical protein